MKRIAKARLGVNGPNRWLQIKTEDTPERWLDVVPTKPVIAQQGFVSMDDEADGHAYNVLSDPLNSESEPMELEGVIYAPQAAMLDLMLDTFTGGAGTPLDVPTVEQAKAWLADYIKRK